MASPVAAAAGFFGSLRHRIRPTDVQAATMWGVAAGTTAIWLVQPFDWIKKKFFHEPEPEGN